MGSSSFWSIWGLGSLFMGFREPLEELEAFTEGISDFEDDEEEGERSDLASRSSGFICGGSPERTKSEAGLEGSSS